MELLERELTVVERVMCEFCGRCFTRQAADKTKAFWLTPERYCRTCRKHIADHQAQERLLSLMTAEAIAMRRRNRNWLEKS